MMPLQPLLAESLAANDYVVAPAIQQQLLQYLALLLQWNRVFNLTAIRNPEEGVLLHLVDSLSIAPYLHGNRLLDVGTGGGLPGIPLALTHPDKQFVLLDSNSKKTRFLVQALATLQIKNVEVVHSRCEDYRPTTGFDSIISRAFASIQVMLETTAHLARDEGRFLAMKGVYPSEEMTNLPEDVKLVNVHKLVIKGLDAERHLVELVKVGKGKP